MWTIILITTAMGAVASVAVPAYLIWRFRHVAPAKIRFEDVQSARIWMELQEQTPILVVVPSLDYALPYLTQDGEVWVSNGPRIFTHFAINKAKGRPIVSLRCCGAAYLMRVAYGRRLAPVVIAVMNGLRPTCAISTCRASHVHPILQWAWLLWSLDGTPWFVLEAVARVLRLRSTAHA